MTWKFCKSYVSCNSGKENKPELDTETNDNKNLDLWALRQENLNKLIIVHLNINSIMNKFELLAQQTEDVNIFNLI